MPTKSITVRMDEDTVDCLDLLAVNFYNTNRTTLIIDIIENYLDNIVIDDDVDLDELPLHISIMLHRKLYDSLHIRSLKLWKEIQGTRKRIDTDYAKDIEDRTLRRQSRITRENDMVYLESLEADLKRVHRLIRKIKNKTARFDKLLKR